MLTRADLTQPPTLVPQFQRLRNVLAGRASGTTLDNRLVSQLIDLLLCKLHDERSKDGCATLRFQVMESDSAESLLSRLNELFSEVKTLPEVKSLFANGERVELNGNLAIELVEVLQRYEIGNAKRDVLGEAFETFIGPSLRGNEGQFFTPRNVVSLAVDVTSPKADELIVDPACGTGGFLTECMGDNGRSSKHPRVIGVDKDEFLARIAAIQIGLLRSDQTSWAFPANSLEAPENWPSELLSRATPGLADVVLTNPPFGANISVGTQVLSQYDLGHIWKRDKSSGSWAIQRTAAKDRPPQILFIERCLQLLKPGGRLAIVLPDGVLGNTNTGYVRAYVSGLADVVAVIDLPLETFMPSTSTKTSLLVLRKRPAKTSVSDEVFMAIAEECGHNRRGKPLYDDFGELRDDFPKVAEKFKEWSQNNARDFVCS